MDEKLLSQLTGEDVSVLEGPRYFRSLLYGTYGVGKTKLAAEIAKALGTKAALFTTDSNWVVLLKYPELAENTRKWDFEGFNQIKAFVQAHSEGIEPFCNYGSLIWDTVSTSCLTVRNNLVRAKKFNDQRDKDVASWTHFNLLSTLFEDVIKELKKSKLHIIYLTHLREPNEQDRARKRFAIRANMPQATYDILAQEVPLIGWVHKEEKGERRKVQFEGTNFEEGKSQIAGIDEITYGIDEIPALIEKWRNR